MKKEQKSAPKWVYCDDGDHIQGVSMQDLSDQFHDQSNFINRLLKNNTGMTYSEYLIILRMEYAQSLLPATDYSVDDIAWMCGYNNKGFFYKRFAAFAGCTPRQYRLRSNNKQLHNEAEEDTSQ